MRTLTHVQDVLSSNNLNEQHFPIFVQGWFFCSNTKSLKLCNDRAISINENCLWKCLHNIFPAQYIFVIFVSLFIYIYIYKRISQNLKLLFKIFKMMIALASIKFIYIKTEIFEPMIISCYNFH